MCDWGLKTTLLVSVLTAGACGGRGGLDLEGPAAQQSAVGARCRHMLR